MTAQQRTFADLIKESNAPISPTQATEQEMKDMAHGESLTVVAVEVKDNEQYGAIYEYDVLRPNGQRRLFGLWANPQRDQTAVTLMTLCQDGPVNGVRLQNSGSDKKPFYVVVPA